MYGSETTGRHFSWRATAALLQARARRFSGSTAADHAPESRNSQDLTGLQHMPRACRLASTDSTALEFADVSLDSLALHPKPPSSLLRKTSHDYIPAVHSSPASDSSALRAVSQTSSGSHQVIPFCHHCGTLLHPKPHASHGLHASLQQPVGESQTLSGRRAHSGSFSRKGSPERGPRRVASSLAAPLRSRAASAGSMSSHQVLSQHPGVSQSAVSNTRQVSVTAAVSADAVFKQLSTFCGAQDMAGECYGWLPATHLPSVPGLAQVRIHYSVVLHQCHPFQLTSAQEGSVAAGSCHECC